MAFEISESELATDANTQKADKKNSYSLNDIKAAAEKLKLLQIELDAMEAQVTIKKSELRTVAEQELPEMLGSVGLPSITLTDGTVIFIADNISASITEDNRTQAHTWLRDNDYGDLIKNVVSVTFGKGEDKEAEKLIKSIKAMAEENALSYGTLVQEEKVHQSTLKAFVKERLANGDILPTDTFKLFIGKICRIKEPKKAKV